MRPLNLRFALATLLALTALAAVAGPSLSVGSPAPAMKVAKWVKGTPVDSFANGKVYVVEFWATWCGPCKQSIPHLTEMAKKYAGKVTFTGVDAFEEQNPTDESYFQKVEDFVKDFGDKMDYNVAIDGKEGTMAKTWMTAANQNGIPTAFVVDQKGQIAWIGHPMAGLDTVLDQVIAGTYDAKAYAKKLAAEQAVAAQAQAKIDVFMVPLQNGDYAKAVAEMDKAFAKDRAVELQFAMLKFQAMAKGNLPGMNDYAKKLANGIYKGSSVALNSLAWTMIDDKNPIKNPDLKLALSLAQQSVDAGEKDNDPLTLAYALDTLALAQYRNGATAKALVTQQRALKLMDNVTDKDPATYKEMQDRLALYKSKAS